jgi:hypothetical protein
MTDDDGLAIVGMSSSPVNVDWAPLERFCAVTRGCGVVADNFM